jgi:rSAM/selenodomain-associated transferase 2
MKLSVIVPMLNESTVLPELLTHLMPMQCDGHEVLLVDGGSQDNSAALALVAGFTVIESAPGRSMQMNAGAGQARGDVLLFLHADTRLPADATVLVANAVSGVAGPAVAWGRFDVRIDGESPWLKVVARMMNLRSRLTGIATGDQAIFVCRSVFNACGGFPAQALMEDIELSRRLKRFSAPACLKAQVITSGRRWESRGVWRTIWLMWRLRFAYWLGASPDSIAKAYR